MNPIHLQLLLGKKEQSWGWGSLPFSKRCPQTLPHQRPEVGVGDALGATVRLGFVLETSCCLVGPSSPLLLLSRQTHVHGLWQPLKSNRGLERANLREHFGTCSFKVQQMTISQLRGGGESRAPLSLIPGQVGP